MKVGVYTRARGMRTQFGFTTLKCDFHNNIESSESRSEMTGADGVDNSNGSGGDLCVRAHAQWMNWRLTAETSEHLPLSISFLAFSALLTNTIKYP